MDDLCGARSRCGRESRKDLQWMALLRDGAPYFVKGACVWGHEDYKDLRTSERVAAAGANSARTYHEKDAQSTLDRAKS
jgi:hypothetical protein